MAAPAVLPSRLLKASPMLPAAPGAGSHMQARRRRVTTRSSCSGLLSSTSTPTASPTQQHGGAPSSASFNRARLPPAWSTGGQQAVLVDAWCIRVALAANQYRHPPMGSPIAPGPPTAVIKAHTQQPSGSPSNLRPLVLASPCGCSAASRALHASGRTCRASTPL